MFDQLRGVSILAVVTIHAISHEIGNAFTAVEYWILSFLMTFCRFAVPCFLIISGFFITYNELEKSATNFKSSIMRRLKRVVPPYVFWSAVYFTFFSLSGVHYAKNPIQIFMEKLLTGTVSIQLYFVVVIIQFYAMTYCGYMQRGELSMLAIFAGLAAYTFVTFVSYDLVLSISPVMKGKAGYYFIAYEPSFFPRWILFFMFGRWMGAHWEKIKKFLAGHRTALGIGVIVTFIFCYFEFAFIRFKSGVEQLFPPDWTFSCMLYSITFTLWILTRPSMAIPGGACLAKLGVLSFSIYLLHEPLLSLLMKQDFFRTEGKDCFLIIIWILFFVGLATVASLLLIMVFKHILPAKIRYWLLG
jgi:surface polysaccharide O-acyltransferase-like enzyme